MDRNDFQKVYTRVLAEEFRRDLELFAKAKAKKLAEEAVEKGKFCLDALLKFAQRI